MKKLFFLILAGLPALTAEAQWWPEVRVTNDPNNSLTSKRRCVSASGDTVHVAWYDDCMQFSTIHYTRSLDAGLNWDTEQMLTVGDSLDEGPCIVSEGALVHIVWYTCEDNTSLYNEIAYMRSTDGGVTWGDKIQLTNSGGLKWSPAIAVSGNYVHLVWHDEAQGDWEIYYMRSPDYGATWEEPVRLTNQFDISAWPSITVSGTVVHIVWHDWRDGNKEVYYKRSADNGTTWVEDIRLTFADADSRYAQIDASGSFVNIVWQDNRDGDYEIYSICSTDGGLTWKQEQRLTYESSPSEYAAVSVSGSVSHIVWQDMMSGLYQIYYKTSQDYGMTWSENERLIETLYNAYRPSVTFSGEWLHVVWYDERDGNNEIYCKNKYVENPIGINEESLDVEGMEWSIYPNPASRQLAIAPSLTPSPNWGRARVGADGSQQTVVNISLFDLYGQEIKILGDIFSFPYTIDIAYLSEGIYFLRVMDEEGVIETLKFLKISE
jgi:hypothetical protein